MENMNMMETEPLELNLPDFDRIYNSAPEANRPSVIKSRKKYTYDINNNRNIFIDDKNSKICSCKSFDNATTTNLTSHHSENWYVPPPPPGIRNNMSNNFNNNKTFPVNYTYENSFYANAPPTSSNNFMSHRKVERCESVDSLPPLEDPPETVKVQVGIDDDLQMILDLDPSIVDLGSTPTITITDQTVTGLPPITGG